MFIENYVDLHRNPVYNTRSKNTSVTKTNTTQNEDEIYSAHDKTDDHFDGNELFFFYPCHALDD